MTDLSKWQGRASRLWLGWLTATSTILFWNSFGPWGAFGFETFLLVAWLASEVYVAGLKKGGATEADKGTPA